MLSEGIKCGSWAHIIGPYTDPHSFQNSEEASESSDI